MTTEEVIADMLIENTGRHILDSGGAYGRHWESNRSQVLEEKLAPVEFFKKQPATSWSYGPTLNVFHFLCAAVDYVPQLDRAWFKWVYSGPEDRYINGTSTAEEFIDQLVKKKWADPDWDFHGTWVNTYNGEDALSQILQYVMFQLTEDCPWYGDTPSWTDGGVVLLSIHGGCDVRGGYTSLRAFAHNPFDGDGPSLFDNAKLTISCQNEDCPMPKEDKYNRAYFMDSDNGGYTWYGEDRDWLEPVAVEDGREMPRCPYCGSELLLSGWCY